MLFKQVLLLACIPCSFYCWNSMESRIMPRDDWTVTMSSTYWPGKRIIDGSNSTLADTCECCSATNYGINPMITIDMKYTYMVSKINVYSRTDEPGNQKLNGLILKLDDKTVDSVDGEVRSYIFVLNQTTPARRVTMMINGENRILVLCEVEIYGYDTVISINKPITVSSNYSGWGNFHGAVDGNISTEGNSCNCCTATRKENNPWLRVDLEGLFYITYIIIYGRTDDNYTEQSFDGMTIQTGNKVFKTLSNTTNFYDSGALHEGPSPDIKLQLPGKKTLVVCELLVFGECYDNYYGNCSLPCGHCFGNEMCNSVDGTCTNCAYGYTETDRLCETTCPNGTYGYNCTQKCGHCINGSYCNQTDGACEQCEDGFEETDRTCKTSCPNGTYGYNCREKCGHCINGSYCNQTDGACEQCEDGFDETDRTCKTSCPNGTYGYNCREKCGHCINGSYCNQTDGACEQCEDGFDETDRTCKTSCPNGTYGYNCTEKCGHCGNESYCNQTDGACEQCEDGFDETDRTCKTSCPNGTYGYNCTQKCGHCRNGSYCNQTDGACEQCEDGFDETDRTCKTSCPNGTYGYNCTQKCGHCRNGSYCNQRDGACEQCEDGFDETDRTCKTSCPNGTYGYNCTQKCGHCRNGSYCNQTDGACEQCEDGFDETDRTCKTSCPNGTYGYNCTQKCGHCRNGSYCNQRDGACEQCEDGFDETDRTCKTSCPNGTYGYNCTQKCGHCRNGSYCNQTDGACEQCEDGFDETDRTCKTLCSNGTYGYNCNETCGQCRNELECNQTNGVCEQCEKGFTETDNTCTTPCEDGTFGHNCTGVCGHCKNERICNKTNGMCDQCEDGYMETDMLCVKQAPQDEEGSNYVGAISGTVVGVIVLACLAIGAIIFKRRSYGKDKTKQKYRNEPNDLKDVVRDRGQQNPGFEAVYPDDEGEEEERGTYYNLVPKTQDIPVSKLWSFVYQTRKHGSEILIKQYKDIGEHISPTKEAIAYRYKVRYKDMLPYDHTRVHLEVEEQGECEFINASHIHGFDRQNKFIASQGPMDVMVDDFWRMVWQQDSRKIVMLTNVIENGSVKCIHYWPELGEVITQGRIQITLVKEETTTDYVIRTLELKQDQSRPRVIQQFHYKAWPDKDVPDSAWSLVMFWREVFKENDSSAGPIIVHCSAGVGRTGTFIALDNLYHQALQTGTINPFEIVSNLRTQRLKMVQTQMQYVYLHDAVAESLSIGTHYIWQTQFESYYNYMVKLDKGASQSRLQNQYQLMLDGMKHMKMAVKGGASEEHIYSNSEINEYRPKAQTSSRYEDVLGGNTLSNYAGKKSFIIMALPNKQEIHRFWNLVERRNIKTVVTLTNDGDPSSKPWSSRSSTKQGGSSTNSPIMVNEDREQGLCIRTYEFTKENKSSNKGNGVVKHFELTTAKSGFPKRDTMVKVLHDVFLWHQYLSESEQILIQCRDGEGQSGMMCVLLNEAARMKDEGHIHVLESVTLMKHQVPKIIPNFEQYKYLHDVILDMVKPKDLPADVNEVEDASIYENVATDKL